MNDAVLAALAAVTTGLLSFAGVYLSNRKSQALMCYRLEQLERKVDQHNRVIERTFRLEERMAAVERDMRSMRERMAQ